MFTVNPIFLFDDGHIRKERSIARSQDIKLRSIFGT
jgi:hypothetical protein